MNRYNPSLSKKNFFARPNSNYNYLPQLLSSVIK